LLSQQDTILTILIVNYKSKKLIVKCLDTLFKYVVNSKFEVIIINNSPEEKIDDLKTNKISIIESNDNIGFGRANNLGAKKAKGEVILLLNPDTLFGSDCITPILLEFQENEKLVAASPQICGLDKFPQVTGFYNLPFGLNIIRQIPYLGNIIGFINRKTKLAKGNELNVNTKASVDWITGASLFIRKSVFDKVGGFDEDFFLYAEETELCSRLKKYGELIVFGEYSIFHDEGATMKDKTSTDRNFFMANTRGKQILVSSFVRIKKEFGNWNVLLVFFAYIFSIPIILACAIISSLFSFSESPIRQTFSLINNLIVVLFLFPKILSSKKYFYKVI
jgi:GT2 family glycosyltransferase